MSTISTFNQISHLYNFVTNKIYNPLNHMKTNSMAEFTLSIYSVKLQVKFPCKMNLQHDGKSLTPEVQAVSNVFTFNQDVSIKVDPKDQVEISVYLSTGKGGSILAGLASMAVGVLAGREGQKFVMPLQKCIDTTATVEIQVTHVWVPQQKVSLGFAKSTTGGLLIRQGSPNNGLNSKRLTQDQIQTRSQIHPNAPRRISQVNFTNHLSKQFGRERRQSHWEINTKKTGLRIQVPDVFQDNLIETRTTGGIGLKQRRQKDKQRMEKLAAKKVSDETQNNLKMDVMKYKLKAQELQKSLSEKTKQIKQLKNVILQHERKQIQRSYLQEELLSKQNNLKVVEDRISSLNNENMSLRDNIGDHLKVINELKESIRFDILKNKQEFETKQQALKIELSESKLKVNELQSEMNNKQSQLGKAKKYIEQLEESAEHKIFEHDHLIQQLRKQSSNQLKGLSVKLKQYEIKFEQMNKQMLIKTNAITKLNETILKMDLNTKVTEEKVQILEMEKNQLLLTKSDFQTLTKNYAKLEDQFRVDQKTNKKILDVKNKEIADALEISSKNVKILESRLGNSNQKIKQQKVKINELESVITNFKNQEEKLKKNLQKSQKLQKDFVIKCENLQKDIRLGEQKIQQYEKELSQKTTNFSHMQSLYKIEQEHVKETNSSLAKEVDELSHKYSVSKQQLEIGKNEKVKLQNKIQLLEQNINRLNENLKQKKTEFEQRDTQYKIQLKDNAKVIKGWEDNDKNKQKQINSWEIKNLTNANKIDKLQKLLQEETKKVDKLEKVVVAKLQEQKEKLIKQNETFKMKLNEMVEQNKLVNSQRVKLESETTKKTKINEVLNEQKTSNISQLNKLKLSLQKYEKNEQKLNFEAKVSLDENKRLNVKLQALQKELIKNKQSLSDTIVSIINMTNASSKKNLKQSGPVLEINTKSSFHVKKKDSLIDNLNSSRVITGLNGQTYTSAQLDIKRIIEIIESTFKQQQNSLLAQQETNIHYKNSIEKLQKEISKMTFTSQSNEIKYQQTIEDLAGQLERSHEQILTVTNNYEDKISKLETQINKKQKDIKLNKSNLSTLKHEIETLNKKLQIVIQEAQIKEIRMEQKNSDLISQLAFLQASIKNLQSEKRQLEVNIYDLEDNLDHGKTQKNKIEKALNDLTEKYAALSLEKDELSRIKKDQTEQILTFKDQLQSLKQINQKNQEQLKNQQKNNKKQQDFINELIKQKQSLVKVELESSSKTIEMQGTVLQIKNLLQNKEQVLRQKQQQLSLLKTSNKGLQTSIKTLQVQNKQLNTKLMNLNAKIQEKQKTIHDKEEEMRQSLAQSVSVSNKLKQEYRILHEEYEMLERSKQIIEEDRNRKIVELTKETESLYSQMQTLQKQLVQKEEFLFFEKQKGSLLQSNLNDAKKVNSESSLIISKYENEVNELNEQITNKQQILYEYSGRIYQLEQKLQAKQNEILIRQQKVDIDWQCKHDEICEQYEMKIEMLEKEKKYLKEKVDFMEIDRVKIIAEKDHIVEQFQDDLSSATAKSKLVEQQKMHQANLKSKEVQLLKNEISGLSSKLKNSEIEKKKKENEILNKDEVIRKLELKLSQGAKGSQVIIRQYEEEMLNLKKNQNTLKLVKEDLKNAQWAAQRESKKILQNFIQKVVNSFPEAKQKLVEPIRSLESSMSSAINFKV